MPNSNQNKSLRGLYPTASINQSGHIAVGALHQVNWKSCDNPNGRPVVFVHGDPGGGTSPGTTQFFNPKKYHIIQFDQHGCGKSTPHACLRRAWSIHDFLASIDLQDQGG